MHACNCIHGFIGATQLLCEISTKSASEYDLRQLEVYEERLKHSGFGNYLVQTSSGNQLSPKLGVVTKNLLLEYEAKVKDANEKEPKRILHQYDEHLCLAGFGNHYDAVKMKDIEDLLRLWIPDLFSQMPSEISNIQPKISNEMPEDISRKEKATQARKSKTGLLTAVNLHLELGMGVISGDELRKLGEYETQLKLAGFGSDDLAKIAISREVPQENNRVTEYTLGMTIESYFSELAEKLIRTDDREAKNMIIGKHEQVLKLAGFGEHYGILKIDELVKELEELRMGLDKILVSNDELNKIDKDVLNADSEVPLDQPETRNNDKLAAYEEKLKLAAFRQHYITIKMKSLRKEFVDLRIGHKKDSREEKAEFTKEMLFKVIKEVENEFVNKNVNETVDWFCTDLPPPKGFNSFYARLYCDLPVSCKAYACSERLRDICRSLERAYEPRTSILRKCRNVVRAFDRYLDVLRTRVLLNKKCWMERRHWKPPPNEEWRRSIILTLFSSKKKLPIFLGIRRLNFSEPLTKRASAVAERLKMIEVKLFDANAKQALRLSLEFIKIVASFDRPYHVPVPGEPFVEPEPPPPPPDVEELEQLRKSKNRAYKIYRGCPCEEHEEVMRETKKAFSRKRKRNMMRRFLGPCTPCRDTENK